MMLTTDQIENWNTVYEKNGLRAEVVDGEGIALYLEGHGRLEMTLAEWKEINTALEGMEYEQV